MKSDILARSALEILRDEEGSVALGWVGAGVFYSRFTGGLSAGLGALHVARLEETLKQVQSLRYFIDSSTVEYYDLCARSSLARALAANRHKFSEVVLLTWAAGVTRTIENFVTSIGNPLTLLSEPRDFDRMLLRAAPLARQRLDANSGWGPPVAASHKLH
jgi:hypothetical protein